MDDLKEKIIEELYEDARKPFSKIAKTLGFSTQTIMRKYNEMKRDGTIVLSSMSLDIEKLGFLGTAHLHIKTKLGVNAKRTVETLRKTPNVMIATRTIGAYEAYAVLAFRSAEELYENVSRIKDLPDVLTLDMSFAMPGIRKFPPKKG
jgi:DNA-binding Lrp family transcriptional regulator